MPLRDDSGRIADLWTRVEPSAPPAAHSILTLEDAEARGETPEVLGLHISNDTNLDRLRPWLDRAALISVDFPAFNDGRGFSLARRLRAMGYRGRLRAAGPVIADQYGYLRECGFDEVEIPEALALRQPEAHWEAAMTRVALSYQQGYAGRRNILAARVAKNAGARKG